ncbi:hypothetical protein HC928_20540 [bacterium]|nr:hypothetical protein [bacterium]
MSFPTPRHQFEVIRLWEQPTEIFLNAPGLLPFAALSQTDNPAEVLQQVAREIEAIGDRRTQNNIAAIAGILGGLVLEQELIGSILRRDVMRESSFYRSPSAAASNLCISTEIFQPSAARGLLYRHVRSIGRGN